MTIAACYLCPEGVVLGADSTTTRTAPEMMLHYNYGQKIFEIGEQGTIGLATWGMAGFPRTSYRTLLARLSDRLEGLNVTTVRQVAEEWSGAFWAEYVESYHDRLREVRELLGRERTPQDEDMLAMLTQWFAGGFCIGGYVGPARQPEAWEITYDLTKQSPEISEIQMGKTRFWGCPNIIERTIFGFDVDLLLDIVKSGKWQGTTEDLVDIVLKYKISQPPNLPIREAIDWVHASINTTIKVMKFSDMAPVCGGPIEVAAITTDRPFRWVCHKKFDAAIDSPARQEA
jgi:hypothetical protein